MQRILPVLLALTLLAAACSDDTSTAPPAPTTTSTATTTTVPATTAAPTTSAPPAVFEPGLVARDCAADELFDAACWWVAVPVQHDDPGGPTYDLAVTHLKSASATPGTPVVYLSGGPGYPGGDPEVWGNSTLLADRDVIVYDQRGTGLSSPNMECPSMEAAIVEILGAALAVATELANRNVAVAACHDQLTAAGIDLNSFSTPHSAADLDLIREALGFERLNLFGVSYGTRLALDMKRQFPASVENTILDSVYPPTHGTADRMRTNANRVFTALLDTCATTTCSLDHPDLAAQFDAAIERYNTTPATLTVPVDGVDRQFELDGADVAAGLFNALYETSEIPLLPTVIESFAAGDTALATVLVDRGVEFLNSAAEGMAMATECADNGNLASAADWEAEFADADIYATLLLVSPASMCPWFPVDPVDPAFNEPVTAAGSTLVLGGTLDPITPPEGVAEVAATLQAPFPLIWEQVGHGVVFADACAAELASEHLRDPGNAKNVECVWDRDATAPWQSLGD